MSATVVFFGALAAGVRAFVAYGTPEATAPVRWPAPSRPPAPPQRTPFVMASDGSGGAEHAVRVAVRDGETICASCLAETATDVVRLRLPITSRAVVAGVCRGCADSNIISPDSHVMDHLRDGTLHIAGLPW